MDVACCARDAAIRVFSGHVCSGLRTQTHRDTRPCSWPSSLVVRDSWASSAPCLTANVQVKTNMLPCPPPPEERSSPVAQEVYHHLVLSLEYCCCSEAFIAHGSREFRFWFWQSVTLRCRKTIPLSSLLSFSSFSFLWRRTSIFLARTPDRRETVVTRSFNR